MKKAVVKPIPLEQMREHLTVDPTSATGLRWVKATSKLSRVKAGAEAGSVTSRGYHHLTFQGVIYRVSRIVFALQTGKDPGEMQVDHINRNRLDNSIQNLRLVTHRENCQNKTDHGVFPVGVCYHKEKRKFIAEIYVNGKRRFLGYFVNPDLASEAYRRACKDVGSLAGSNSAK